MTATETPFVLPEQINISAVENLFERLSGERYSERIKLDGGHIESVDTTGLQLWSHCRSALLVMVEQLGGSRSPSPSSVPRPTLACLNCSRAED